MAAVVVMEPDQPFDEMSLIQFCRTRLAGYKMPRRWLAVDELPQTSSGKIARRAVQDLFTTEDTENTEKKL